MTSHAVIRVADIDWRRRQFLTLLRSDDTDALLAFLERHIRAMCREAPEVHAASMGRLWWLFMAYMGFKDKTPRQFAQQFGDDVTDKIHGPAFQKFLLVTVDDEAMVLSHTCTTCGFTGLQHDIVNQRCLYAPNGRFRTKSYEQHYWDEIGNGPNANGDTFSPEAKKQLSAVFGLPQQFLFPAYAEPLFSMSSKVMIKR